jgi:hypothetical protein
MGSERVGIYGASVAAVAVGTARENYRATPEIRSKLGLLRAYPGREGPRQSALYQVFLLWASAKWPELIGPRQRESIIHEVRHGNRTHRGLSRLPPL